MDKTPKRLPTDPYKGVRDFYPEDQAVQDYLFATMREVAEKFGYAHYSASLLEPAELYRMKGADNAEMVNEQTYTFMDRGDREVTLRPEMTPSVARMVAARRRELGFPLRLYSIPNVFRYERPQRGRLREHWQLNMDIFGAPSPFAEVEIISAAAAIMKAFGASNEDFSIHIGSRPALEQLFSHYGLNEGGAKKLRGLIDRKNKISTEEFAGEAAGIVGKPFELPQSEPTDVSLVRRMLGELGVTNTVYDPSIVRGFEYYTGLVFEVFDTSPENNRSLFGGGRYDNLLQMFGEEPVGAVGFGMGDVTMRDFLETRGRLPSYRAPAQVYIAAVDGALVPETMKIAEELRAQNVGVEVNLTDRKLADQIKVADKHRIPYLLVVGKDELESGNFKVRDLATGAELVVSRDGLHSFFLSIT